MVAVVVAVGFVVVVGRGELVGVDSEVALVDGPTVVVVVDSSAPSGADGVASPPAEGVVTIVVAVVSVLRAACSVFDPCEEAPAIPAQTGTIQMRTCAQRGSLRKRSQKLMSDGNDQA